MRLTLGPVHWDTVPAGACQGDRLRESAVAVNHFFFRLFLILYCSKMDPRDLSFFLTDYFIV